MAPSQARSGFAATLFLVLVACTARAPLPDDFEQAMLDLEHRTLTDLAASDPDIRDAIDDSVGYAIFSNHATKVPLVGRGEGLGLVVDRSDGTRHYLRLTHVDIGGGLGDLHFRLVIAFFDRKDFERIRSGTLRFGASMDVASGSRTAGHGGVPTEPSARGKRLVHVIHDRGAAASWTVRLLRFVPIEP